MNNKTATQSGYIALVTVLVVSAVVILISTTVAFLAIGEAQQSLALTKGEGNLLFTEGCMEDALIKARASSAYTGGTITEPEGTCTVTVSKAGTTWTLTAVPNTTDFSRTIQVVVVRSSSLVITSWKEI